MNVERLSAFADQGVGGNPAGVVIADDLPTAEDMQAIARHVGYSETAFAAPLGDGWQVRYFSPEGEVAFCGHATIALGAALGRRFGAGVYDLTLSQSRITVSATEAECAWRASLQSPPTWSQPLPEDLTAGLLDLFGVAAADLEPRLPPRLAFAGVRHAVLTLRDRATLAAMRYEFEAGRALMAQHDLTTISLLHILNDATVAARNAFAIGGVVEDAATGAAAAALGGVLVDIGWPGLAQGGRFTILQGQDMGAPSRLEVEVSGIPGASVRVSGAVRVI